MAEKEYIERDAAMKIADSYSLSNGCTLGRHSGIADDISAQILRIPAADVVSRSAYDQIRWERDLAMQQLDEAGIPFGGKSDKEYAPVVRCEHCKHCKMVVDIIGDPHLFCGLSSNNAAVQFGDFCSYGEPKEATP